MESFINNKKLDWAVVKNSLTGSHLFIKKLIIKNVFESKHKVKKEHNTEQHREHDNSDDYQKDQDISEKNIFSFNCLKHIKRFEYIMRNSISRNHSKRFLKMNPT